MATSPTTASPPLGQPWREARCRGFLHVKGPLQNAFDKDHWHKCHARYLKIDAKNRATIRLQGFDPGILHLWDPSSLTKRARSHDQSVLVAGSNRLYIQIQENGRLPNALTPGLISEGYTRLEPLDDGFPVAASPFVILSAQEKAGKWIICAEHDTLPARLSSKTTKKDSSDILLRVRTLDTYQPALD